jgi:ribonuclease HI
LRGADAEPGFSQFRRIAESRTRFQFKMTNTVNDKYPIEKRRAISQILETEAKRYKQRCHCYKWSDKMSYTAYFDGACAPINPGGTAGYGAVIFDRKQSIWDCSGIYHPPKGHERETSNNVAEYSGLIAVLQWLTEHGLHEARIRVLGDSELVINQVFGTWRIKRGLYVPLAYQTKALRKPFTNIEGHWIPRSKNTIADRLAKAAVKRSR